MFQTPPRHILLLLALAAGAILQPLAVAAQEYRVIPGDVLRVTQVEIERPEEVAIDLDGRIRVPGVGTIAVAGLTLDEVEARIDEAIASEGLVLDLESTVSISAYAPVVVMGDVARPGRFDYIPGMTVATALGLSGGSRSVGVDPLQIERATAEVSGQVQVTGLEIATAASEIARLEAALGGNGEIQMEEGLRRSVPVPDRARLEGLVKTEAELLANDRAHLAEQLQFWNGEIASLEEQSEILEARLIVQKDLIDQAVVNLENALTLQERGLQTSSVLTRVQQAEAEARARSLELESLGLNILRNLSEARRARARFERNRTEEALGQLRTARARHQDAVIRHARAIEQQAILQGGSIGSLLTSDAIRPVFRILRSRPDSEVPADLGIEARLMPGDTLIVTMDVAVPQDG